MKSVLLDTNIFIRYFLRDIPAQYEEVKHIFEDIENNKLTGTISILVINEIIWVLEHYYSLKRNDYLPSLLGILLLKNIKVKEAKKDLLIEVLKKMQESSIDFTDIYLFFISEKQEIKTFDKQLKNMKK